MKLRVNGDVREVSAPSTLESLIVELGLGGKRLAVELNGEIVPRSEYGTHSLREGDQLEIVQAIGGGSLSFPRTRESSRKNACLTGFPRARE